MKRNWRDPASLRIRSLIFDNPVSPEKRGEPQAYDFYIDRLYELPKYGEKSGFEMLALICRCAFWDDVLTDAESISIIKICQSANEWHKIFMEANYNEGWN